MAYIPEFEYDIFFSYAHLDNKPLPNEEKGWVHEFYEYLECLLNKRCGRNGRLKIWWDERKLDGNVYFDDSIAEGIKKSAILICFNSTSYDESDYCRQELSTFYDKALNERLGMKVGHRSRIVHVLLENLPFSDWLKPLEGVPGIPFYVAKTEDHLGDPITPVSDKFPEHMKDFRDSIWDLIKNIKAENSAGDQSKEEAKPKKSDAFSIYLSEVSDTLRSPRKRLKADLENKGFNVTMGIPPPDDAESHEQAVKTAVDNSQLTVHLLDFLPGREIVGDSTNWYSKKQVEIAMESNTPQVVWIPMDTGYEDIEEEDYKSFLMGLENEKCEKREFDFIKGSKSTLADKIIGFIKELKEKQKVETKTEKIDENGPLSVLLDYHDNDNRLVRNLTNSLTDNEIRPYFAPTEDDPHQNSDKFQEQLKELKKFVFLYGDVENGWITERIKYIMKKLIDCNRFNCDDIFVLMAPPHKDETLINLPVKIFNHSKTDRMDDDSIQKFLEDLKTQET